MQKYFSYANWEVVFGSAFSISDEDREKLRQFDGTEAIPIGKTGIFDEKTYMIETPWGIRMYPAIVVKDKDEPDISLADVLRNPHLQKEIAMQNRKETMFEDIRFTTIAYIDMDSVCGFAMVSVGTEPGTFLLQSSLYEIPIQLKEKIDYEIRPKFWQYLSNGILSGTDGAKVYRMNIDRILHYIEELFPDTFNASILDKKNAYNYLDTVGSNEYESDSAFNKMLQQREKYEKQCIRLLESLNLHVISPEVIVRETTPRVHDIFNSTTTKKHENYLKPAVNTPKGSKSKKIQALKRQGLTIGQVAQKLGMSYSAVSKWW